jgi:F-type H+-transporting ATPase subunit b
MLPQLDISNFLSQTFWLVISFSLLYILISKVVIPSIQNILDKRSKDLYSILEKAEKNNEEAKKLANEALDIEKSNRIELLNYQNSFIDKLKKENSTKFDQIALELSKEYQITKAQYEQKLKELSQDIPEILEELSLIVINKISDKKERL